MTGPLLVHGTSVALAGRGLLIGGASGAGKSGLALQLMALGATLVSDDQTQIEAAPEGLRMTAPASIRGLIEARGLGLLQAQTVASAPLFAVLDLDIEETDRLPPVRVTDILGHSVTLLHKQPSASFPAALVQYLRAGRQEIP